MMRLVRRPSLLIVPLLVSVGTASAECAWVLWKFPTGKYYKAGVAGELPEKEIPVDLRRLPPRIDRAFPTYKECMQQPEHRPLEKGEVWTASAKSDTGTEVLVGVAFRCLPDGVDPRGPKGK